MPDPALPTELTTALQVVTMPRDANQYGTIFGGVILSYIDQAGFIEVRRHGTHRWVTVALDSVEFKAPVLVGDLVTFRTCTVRLGTKSVRVRIVVEAERYSTLEVVTVTEAEMTMVAVDASGAPIPFRHPSTVSESASFGAEA
ncbi:MAG: acyl-CoA thioesterase [Planctomycetota bacterium]|jgi:acyl-CoA thioesterase YciA